MRGLSETKRLQYVAITKRLTKICEQLDAMHGSEGSAVSKLPFPLNSETDHAVSGIIQATRRLERLINH